MNKPIVAQSVGFADGERSPIAAAGSTFDVYEWSGSGPEYLHMHHADDEAWHVLEGVLTFRFSDRTVEAPAGTTVFVPAGVPHAYYELSGPTRYLIILTPRLRQLIAALHSTPIGEHDAIMRRYDSEIVG